MPKPFASYGEASTMCWPRDMGSPDIPSKPCGELVTRIVAMPKDTNPNGYIFGGWLTAQMAVSGHPRGLHQRRSRSNGQPSPGAS